MRSPNLVLGMFALTSLFACSDEPSTIDGGGLDASARDAAPSDATPIEAEVEDAQEFGLASPPPSVDELRRDVFAEELPA